MKYYIDSFKCKKISSEESKEMFDYDVVEYKYPGQWCVLHSNGRKCVLESKDGIIHQDEMNIKCDLVGHYWKFKGKYKFTYFDIITINNENLTHSTLMERRQRFAPYVRNQEIPQWVEPSIPSKVERWEYIWREKVLVKYRGVNFEGLVFKKHSSKFGENIAVLNKTI